MNTPEVPTADSILSTRIEHHQEVARSARNRQFYSALLSLTAGSGGTLATAEAITEPSPGNVAAAVVLAGICFVTGRYTMQKQNTIAQHNQAAGQLMAHQDLSDLPE